MVMNRSQFGTINFDDYGPSSSDDGYVVAERLEMLGDDPGSEDESGVEVESVVPRTLKKRLVILEISFRPSYSRQKQRISPLERTPVLKIRHDIAPADRPSHSATHPV